MGEAGIVHVRLTRPAHAPTRNEVGGYMREGEEKKNGRAGLAVGWGRYSGSAGMWSTRKNQL